MKLASNILITLLWILAIAGGLIGGYFLAMTLLQAQSAPQEAAGAAYAATTAIVPYVIARSFSEIAAVDWR